MDKLILRPRELHIEPEQPHAASVLNFWLRTVDDFISTLQELRSDDDPEVNKKRVIINCLSPVYPHVEEAETYDMIVQFLKALYVKKKNNVYARHLLVSRRQGSDESISEFLHVLKGLAKDCTFSVVTADTYREELSRDAFINGLASAAVPQRLLEKEELALNQAFKLADNLDRVHRYSNCMGSLDPDQSLSLTRLLKILVLPDLRRDHLLQLLYRASSVV